MPEEIHVFADKELSDTWRVEVFDEDGGCAITVFIGANPEGRARRYAEWPHERRGTEMSMRPVEGA